MKKLNNKGYMLIEIILASVITFSIAFFLMNLIVKFKNSNEDLYNDTAILNDKIAITKNIMNDLETCKIIKATKSQDEKAINLTVKDLKDNNKKEKRIEITNNLIVYGDYENNNFITNNKSYFKKELSNSTEIGIPEINAEGKVITVSLPISSIYSKKNYNVNLFLNLDKIAYQATFYGHGAIHLNDSTVLAKYSGLSRATTASETPNAATWYDLSDENGYKNANITNGVWKDNYLQLYTNNPTMVDAGLIQAPNLSLVTRFKTDDVSEGDSEGTLRHIIGNYKENASGCKIVLNKNLFIVGTCAISNVNNEGNPAKLSLTSNTKINNLNETYSVALTYEYNVEAEETQMYLYLNGRIEKKLIRTKENTTDPKGPILMDNATHMYIGATTETDTNSLKGRIYEVAITNSALSQDTIIQGQYKTVFEYEKFEEDGQLYQPAISGKTFAGWYKTISLADADKIDANTIVGNANAANRIGIYAKWQ